MHSCDVRRKENKKFDLQKRKEYFQLLLWKIKKERKNIM